MPTTLRRTGGSYPTVKAVLAYSEQTGDVAIRLQYLDGTEGLDTVPLSELEALDGNNRYVPVEPIVRARAGAIIRRRGEVTE